jgi:hypothetical protein
MSPEEPPTDVPGDDVPEPPEHDERGVEEQPC